MTPGLMFPLANPFPPPLTLKKQTLGRKTPVMFRDIALPDSGLVVEHGS